MKTRPNGKQYEPCHVVSAGNNRLIKWCNIYQTAEERRDNYAFCRLFGLPWQRAQQLRDCHWPVINRYIEAYRNPTQLSLPITTP